MQADRLKESFHRGLDLPPDTDLLSLNYADHPHWDSLGHLSLVVAIEEDFGITFDDDEVLALDSYRTAAEIIAKKEANQL